MPADVSDLRPLILPRVGAVVVGAAMVVPALRLPLILGCLAALGSAAWSRGRAADVMPETPPVRPRQSRTRRRNSQNSAENGAADSTEDSFPASDPPSRTPVTGTRTRH
jgi:hypothetical protein